MDLGEQLKTFSKDSIRLVKRCTKPDAKGRSNRGRLPSVERERERERKRSNRPSASFFDRRRAIDGRLRDLLFFLFFRRLQRERRA